MTEPNVYITLNDNIKKEINKIIPNPGTSKIDIKLVGVPILAIYQDGQIIDTPIPLTDELAGNNEVLKIAMTKFKSTMSNTSSPNKTLTNASSSGENQPSGQPTLQQLGSSSSGGKRRKTNRKSHKRIRKTNRSRRVRW